MSRYTLKVCYGTEQLERYNHRSRHKLQEILFQDRYHHPGETGPFGEELKNPDHFEILDSQMEKIHQGNIIETLQFVGNLR